MRSTTTFDRGDIVYLPFEFSDRPVLRRRPALVVSSTAYHQSRHEVVVAAITSRVRSPLFLGDYLLESWGESGLERPSVVTAIIRTVRREMIERVVGRIPQRDLAAFDANLRLALAL